EVDRASRLLQCGRPGLDVRDITRADAVDLDVVDAPGGELVRPGVDERLRTGPGVVDADHALAVIVLLAGRRGDVVGVVAGALNGGVLSHRLLGDARRDVQAEQQAVVMYVVGYHLDTVDRPIVRKLGGVGDPAAVLIYVWALAARALVPEIIDVNVLESDRGQAAVLHRVRLCLDLGGRRVVPDEAPAAPS